MDTRVGKGIVVGLTAAFLVIALVGARLIVLSAGAAEATEEGATAESSAVELSAGDDFSLKIETAIPGVIVFAFGAAGLIMMLIKVPVSELLTRDQATPKHMASLQWMGVPPTSGSFRVPLLLWWVVLKPHGGYVRAQRQ